MNFLPIFMVVKDRLCLVIGGGEVAQRKASVLVGAGAVVKMVAPEFLAELTSLMGIEGVGQRFQPGPLGGVVLALVFYNILTCRRATRRFAMRTSPLRRAS